MIQEKAQFVAELINKIIRIILREEGKGITKTLEEPAYGTPRLLNPSSCDET